MTTVLILDDSEISLGLYRVLLEEAGMQVHTATSLFEFEDLVRETDPSLILCDVMMPELLGDAVCRVLRSQYGLRTTPIVLLSGLPKDELSRAAVKAGADGFIEKDEALATLADRVRGFLAQRPAA
jgi:CheY-like chemotaxis protein